MVIQARVDTTGNARDVICDTQGRLVIAGVTLNLSGAGLSVDLTSTNALLTQVVNSLSPTSGKFLVDVNNIVTVKDTPPIKVDLQVLNPALLFPTRINSIAPGTLLDVNLKSADPAFRVDVRLTDVTATAPLNVVVNSFNPAAIVKVDLSTITATTPINVNVNGLNTTLFPNGFPIDIRNFSAGSPVPFRLDSINTSVFPNGIPVNLSLSSALAVTLDTSTIPLRVTVTGQPLAVTITTPVGGLPVGLDTTQYTNLINTINNANIGLRAGTEVIIRDADGILSDSNPLRTRGALIDGAGTLVSTTNRLPVSAQLLGANGNPLSPTNALLVTVDPLSPLDAKVQVVTKNVNTVVVADNTLQPLQVLSTGDLVTGRRLYTGPSFTIAGVYSTVAGANFRTYYDVVFDPSGIYNYIIGYTSAGYDASDMTGNIYVYATFTVLPAAHALSDAMGIAIQLSPDTSGNEWASPSQSYGLVSEQIGFKYARLYTIAPQFPSVRMDYNVAGARRFRILAYSSANSQGNLTASIKTFYTKI